MGGNRLPDFDSEIETPKVPSKKKTSLYRHIRRWYVDLDIFMKVIVSLIFVIIMIPPFLLFTDFYWTVTMKWAYATFMP